jgi:hypothetical protein
MHALRAAQNAARSAEFASLRRSALEARGAGHIENALTIEARLVELSNQAIQIGDLFEIDGIELEVHYFDGDQIVTCGRLDGRAYVFTQSELLSARSMKGSN